MGKKFSKTQIQAIDQIKELIELMGMNRKFIQAEVNGIGANTLNSLVQKGVLSYEWIGNNCYYQVLNFQRMCNYAIINRRF